MRLIHSGRYPGQRRTPEKRLCKTRKQNHNGILTPKQQTTAQIKTTEVLSQTFSTQETPTTRKDMKMGQNTPSPKTPKRKEEKTLKTIISPGKEFCESKKTPGTGLNVSLMDFVWNEDEGRSMKRKRYNTPVNEVPKPTSQDTRMGKKLGKIMRQLKDHSLRMTTLARENRNTKVEIKDAILKMRSIVSQLTTTEMRMFLEDKITTYINVVVIQDDKEDKGVQAKCQTRDVGCQTIGSECLQTDIENVKKYEDLQEIVKLRWPEKLYKKAFYARGSILEANKDTDLFIWDADGEEQANRAVLERHTELANIEGETAHLYISTRTKDKLGTIQQYEKAIVKLETYSTDRQNMFRTFVPAENRDGNRKKMAIQPIQNDKKGSKLRKMLECIFQKTDIKCIIYAGDVEQGKRQKGTQQTPIHRVQTKQNHIEKERKHTEAIVVSQKRQNLCRPAEHSKRINRKRDKAGSKN